MSPLDAREWRDGAYAAAAKMNSENRGRGIRVAADSYVRLRLVTIISGSKRHPDYSSLHDNALEYMLGPNGTYYYGKPALLVGCSGGLAEAYDEKWIANRTSTITIGQMGPSRAPAHARILPNHART